MPKINDLKNTERNTKQQLMRHYLELLYNGQEIRNDGLIWIIKAMWKMGGNMPLSFMPTFLDHLSTRICTSFLNS